MQIVLENGSNNNVQLTLPYIGKNNANIMAIIKKNLQQYLMSDINIVVAYKSKKLNTQFITKDNIEFQHKSNVVDLCECPEGNCKAKYIGETKRRIGERMIDHNKQDKSSHVLQHSIDNNHPHVWIKTLKS